MCRYGHGRGRGRHHGRHHGRGHRLARRHHPRGRLSVARAALMGALLGAPRTAVDQSGRILPSPSRAPPPVAALALPALHAPLHTRQRSDQSGSRRYERRASDARRSRPRSCRSVARSPPSLSLPPAALSVPRPAPLSASPSVASTPSVEPSRPPPPLAPPGPSWQASTPWRRRRRPHEAPVTAPPSR